MPAPIINTADFSAILQQVLVGVKGLEVAAIQTLVAQYAPRLAALATSDDPSGEASDILTNAKLAYEILGVEAETIGAQAIETAITTATSIMLKLAISTVA